MASPGPGIGPGPSSNWAAPILPGFDVQIQRQLDNLPISPALFTDIYTVHNRRLPLHIQTTLDRQDPGARAQYGNNITLLFRACFHCHDYWRSPHFWPAIASAFKPDPESDLHCDFDMIETLAEILVRARKVYLSNVTGPKSPGTGATKAVDVWTKFIHGRADSYRSKGDRVQLFDRLDNYLSHSTTSQFLQIDSAWVAKFPQNCDAPRTGRKRQRSLSPNPTTQAPDAKRKPSESSFDMSGRSSPVGWASTVLPRPPPLKTEFRTLDQAAQANQPYQTPVSANDRTKQDGYLLHQSPLNMKGGMSVRGCAQQASSSSTRRDSLPEAAGPSNANLEVARLQEKVLALEEKARQSLEEQLAFEKERHSLKEQLAAAAQPKENELSIKIDQRLAMVEKRLGPANQDTMTTDFQNLQTIITSFKDHLAEAERKRVQDVEYTRGMFRSASKQAETIQKLEIRIASLETKVDPRSAQSRADDATSDRGKINDEVLAKVAHAEARVTLLESKEDYGESLRESQSRLATHEHQPMNVSKLVERGSPAASEDLIKAATRSLTDRLVSLETQQGELEKRAATKTFVEANSRSVKDRLASLDEMLRADIERNAASKDFMKTAAGDLGNRLDVLEKQQAASAKLPAIQFERNSKRTDDHVASLRRQIDAENFKAATFRDDVIKALRDRITVLEKQQADSAKLAATKAFDSKRTDDHVASLERQIAADKFKAARDRDDGTRGLGDRIAALESQGTQLHKAIEMLKTTELPETPRSPSPLQDVQHSMEDMRKELKNLPTMSVVSQKMVQNEMNMRSMFDDYERGINERLEAFTVQVGTAKAQIKGFNQLLNQTNSDMVKRDDVKALEGRLVDLTRQLDAAKQSQAEATKLEEKIKDLTKVLDDKIGNAVDSIAPADLPNGLQEVQTRIEDLTNDVALMRSRVDTVSRGLGKLIAAVTEGAVSG